MENIPPSKHPPERQAGPGRTHLQCGHCRPRPRHRRRCWPPRPPRLHTGCRACRDKSTALAAGGPQQGSWRSRKRQHISPSVTTVPHAYTTHSHPLYSACGQLPPANSPSEPQPEPKPAGETSASRAGQVLAQDRPCFLSGREEKGGREQARHLLPVVIHLCVPRLGVRVLVVDVKAGPGILEGHGHC